jgi:hypothetical protein
LQSDQHEVCGKQINPIQQRVPRITERQEDAYIPQTLDADSIPGEPEFA